MNNEIETKEDIVREMRDLGELDQKSTDKIPRSLMGLGLRTYADRLEAAYKRELQASSGNAALMREALEDSQSQLESFSWGDYGAQVREQMRDNQAALAASPRNCDVYKTSWDVVKHWDGGLDSAQNIVRMLDWLLAPVKPEIKGEAKRKPEQSTARR